MLLYLQLVGKIQNILNASLALFLCLQLINICVYIPSWMYPGQPKADMTESVLELVVESVSHNEHTMYDADNCETSNYPTLNEEILLEDLHPPEDLAIKLTVLGNSLLEHNYYHFTPDIKDHVLSVVSPPPDVC